MSKLDLTEIRFLLTTSCNLNCSYCYMMKIRQSIDTMSIDVADRAMSFIDKQVCEGIKIDFFGGEPLLQFDLIKHVIERYPVLNYGLSTNGMNFNEEMLEFFTKHKDFVMVQFSLDGGPEIQMKNRGAVPNYDLIRLALKDMCSNVRVVCEDPSVLVDSVSFLVDDLGAKEVKVGIPIFYKNRDGYKHQFLDQLDIAKMKYPLVDISCDNMTCEKSCYAVDNHIAIAPNGDIYPCDIFYFKGLYKIGDIINGIDKDAVESFKAEAALNFDPLVPCLAHKMFMKDTWIN